MELWENNATSVLAADADSADVSLTLAAGTGALFPSPTGAEYFWLTLVQGDLIEIVKVTSRSGDVLSVDRGLQGVPASDFTIGAVAENRVTRVTLEDLRDATGAFYTIAETDTLLAGKSDVGHSHPLGDLTGAGAVGGYIRSDGSEWVRVDGVAWDDLTSVPTTLAGYGLSATVYTKAETAFAIASSPVFYTKTAMDFLLFGKSDTGHVHPASEISTGTFGAGDYTFPGNLTLNGNILFGTTDTYNIGVANVVNVIAANSPKNMYLTNSLVVGQRAQIPAVVVPLHVVQPLGAQALRFDFYTGTLPFGQFRANGTPAIPTKTLAADTLGGMAGFNHTGAAFGSGPATRILFIATENGDVGRGSYMQFGTSPSAGSVTARWRVTENGHLWPELDASYDVGATASTFRPRDLFLSRDAVLGGAMTVGGNLIVSGVGPHAVGTATISRVQLNIGGTIVLGSGGTGYGLRYVGNLTPFTTNEAYGLDISPTLQTNIGTTHSYFAGARFEAPTITLNGGGIVTEAATVRIDGAPTNASGTNYALDVRGGTSRFSGPVSVIGTTTHTGDLLFTDATYDIGKSAATRPRDIFTSRDVTVGRRLGVGVTSASASLEIVNPGVSGVAFQMKAANGNTGFTITEPAANNASLNFYGAGGSNPSSISKDSITSTIGWAFTQFSGAFDITPLYVFKQSSGFVSDLFQWKNASLAVMGEISAAGYLRVPDGDATTPGHSFHSDTNTGWYRIGVDNIGLTLAGAKVVDYAVGAVTLTADLKFIDATYDIGKSLATRPRDLFLSRDLVVGGTLGVTGAVTLSDTLRMASTKKIFLTAANSFTYIYESADGVMDLVAGNTNLLRLSGTTVLLTGLLQIEKTGELIRSTTATANPRYMRIANNTGDALFGVEGTTGGTMATGTTGGATFFSSQAAKPIQFAPNTVVQLTINSGGGIQWGGNVLNDLIFTDALYDIGKVGATRPRDIFQSRNLVVGGTATVVGAFGCNGKAAQTAVAAGTALAAYAAGANGLGSAANMSAMHALVVLMRSVLIANGQMS